MESVTLTIDGQAVEVAPGTTILDAARRAGVYIPAVCGHPDLPPSEGTMPAKAVIQGGRRIEDARPEERGGGCGLCVVEVEGRSEPVRSCATVATPGMVVITDNEQIRIKRREHLIPILARHRHACLTCAQQDGCSRSSCSCNVPEYERCCARFGHCELQAVTNYVGIPSNTPRWKPSGLPAIDDHPHFCMDYNQCIGCTRCVRACRHLRGIGALGFVRDDMGRVQVGSLAPTLEESGCTSCALCAKVCPTGALVHKSMRPGKQREGLFTCEEARPADTPMPAYLRRLIATNPLPRERLLPLDRENVGRVPEEEGVFLLYDQDRQILSIKGTVNLREALHLAMVESEKASSFEYELDKMYSKRESELLQRYLQEHGRMPGAGDEDDDLF